MAAISIQTTTIVKMTHHKLQQLYNQLKMEKKKEKTFPMGQDLANH